VACATLSTCALVALDGPSELKRLREPAGRRALSPTCNAFSEHALIGTIVPTAGVAGDFFAGVRH